MIPVNEPVFADRDRELVADCVARGWVSSAGEYIDRFEADWAAYCGRRHGVAVCNGTAALQLAVEALNLPEGSEVILPSFTIVSCALAVIRAGLTPVLVDADPATWTMDPEQTAARIGPRTAALMPVHIYSHPAAMEPLLALAGRHGLHLVEDAAEAHGARVRVEGAWTRCGGMGTFSTFSFYANKLITTGEGGMVVTDDPGLAARARSLRNLCFGTADRFRHEGLGHNWRMTNMQAALGVAQSERIDTIVARKRAIGEAYAARLGRRPELHLQSQQPWAESVYWMNGIALDAGTGWDARGFAAALAERGVQTRPFFTGMHEQPVLRARGLFAGETHPVTEGLSRRGLYLPSGLGLSDDQIATVCAAVEAVLDAGPGAAPAAGTGRP